MLDGAARKIGLVLAGATFLPWLLIVIGFGLFTTGSGIAPVGSVLFPFWFISLFGIPIISIANIHAVISKPPLAKILTSIATLMSILFLLSLGMILYYAGTAIVNLSNQGLFNSSFNLLFAGALLAILTWTPLMMLWSFYEMPSSLGGQGVYTGPPN